MSKLRIWIDAGHGGTDPGASKGNLCEKEITLDICMRLGALLSTDFNVLYSRTDDKFISIDDRWKAANTAEMDCFIAIHVNAGGGTGVETFYYKEDSERSRKSEALAKIVNDTYAEMMGLRNRGVKSDTQTNVGSIGVLRRTNMPAILVELGFLDCPAGCSDIDILQNKRDEIVQALARGIYKYLGIEPSQPAQSTQPEPEKLYRVQMGAFRIKSNAEALAARLKELGFDTYITS